MVLFFDVSYSQSLCLMFDWFSLPLKSHGIRLLPTSNKFYVLLLRPAFCPEVLAFAMVGLPHRGRSLEGVLRFRLGDGDTSRQRTALRFAPFGLIRSPKFLPRLLGVTCGWVNQKFAERCGSHLGPVVFFFAQAEGALSIRPREGSSKTVWPG